MSLSITTNASRQIRKLLDKQNLPEGGLRVAIKAGGCSGLSYAFEWEPAAAPTDHVFAGENGARVFVDGKSLKFLEGTELDYDTSLLSKGFILHNPQAKSSCGCGTSFSIG